MGIPILKISRKTVSSLTWGSLYWQDGIFILRRLPGRYRHHSVHELANERRRYIVTLLTLAEPSPEWSPRYRYQIKHKMLLLLYAHNITVRGKVTSSVHASWLANPRVVINNTKFENCLRDNQLGLVVNFWQSFLKYHTLCWNYETSHMFWRHSVF